VRGKNIMWLSLIAMLFATMMANIVTAATPGKLFVDPKAVSGSPGDEFTIDINVDLINDLYAFGMTVDFAPYVSVLVVSKVAEGPFLKQGGSTYFKYTYSSFKGEVKVGCTLLGPLSGVSGAGTLFSITFIVVEAGDSQLDLLDTALLDSNLNPLNYSVTNGYYSGATVNLISMVIAPGRSLTSGQTVEFQSSIKNMDPDKTMDAQVRFDILREDGWRTTIWAGQAFVTKVRDPVTLYVNEYNEWLEWDWTNPGASVIGMPDGDYAESIVNGAMSSAYGFDDLVLNPGDVIGNIKLEGYCQYPNGATDAVDIDMYSTDFDWFGSLYGGPDFGWVSPRWIGADVSDVRPDLLGKDATALNNLEVLLYNYEGNADNPMRVDSLRLIVSFSQVYPAVQPTYTIGPKEELVLDPATWALADLDEGTYTVTCTVLYTYVHYSWIAAHKIQTRSFRVSA